MSWCIAALRQLPRDPIAKPLVEASLGLRLDLLIEIAKGHDGGEWPKLAVTFEKIKQLSGKRNLVAHNGLGYDVYTNSEGEVFFDDVITSIKKPRSRGLRLTELKDEKYRMSFDDLVKHRKQAEKLELELLQVMMDLFVSIGQKRHQTKLTKKAQDLSTFANHADGMQERPS